ncbi:hypothetical protein BGX29_002765 [Mortierella sp. GBA35]|nr:hypothetical protein BGX29_002765 [Mortierella sp. GBA35]
MSTYPAPFNDRQVIVETPLSIDSETGHAQVTAKVCGSPLAGKNLLVDLDRSSDDRRHQLFVTLQECKQTFIGTHLQVSGILETTAGDDDGQMLEHPLRSRNLLSFRPLTCLLLTCTIIRTFFDIWTSTPLRLRIGC